MKIVLSAAEISGDVLGAQLMAELQNLSDAQISFSGVGGAEMTKAGLSEVFPCEDIAVMGLGPVIAKLPTILKRIHQLVDHIVEVKPDAVVLIDGQEFSRQVARKVRARGVKTKIFLYVSPTVWAWRPKRAKKLKKLFDAILCLLPFEPEALERLEGPEGIYVGHPLLTAAEKASVANIEAAEANLDRMQLLLLPGSRRAELERMLPVFQKTVETLGQVIDFHCVIPAVLHLAEEIEAQTKNWQVPVTVLRGLSLEERLALYGRSQAALATSGTVALELALMDCPLVVAYKVSPLLWPFRFIVKAPFISLPNLILGRGSIAERLQGDAEPDVLARDLLGLLTNEEFIERQKADFADMRHLMQLKENRRPGRAAAEAILAKIG